ncbi:hypothetical protein ACWGJ2_06410 [Streptomyces sp. NPDC054796]
MTAQSGRGQGDEPLYEGVVLPANGDPWTPEQQRQVAQSTAQPLAGQPWGQPWGPESSAATQQPPAESYGTAGTAGTAGTDGGGYAAGQGAYGSDAYQAADPYRTEGHGGRPGYDAWSGHAAPPAPYGQPDQQGQYDQQGQHGPYAPYAAPAPPPMPPPMPPTAPPQPARQPMPGTSQGGQEAGGTYGGQPLPPMGPPAQQSAPPSQGTGTYGQGTYGAGPLPPHGAQNGQGDHGPAEGQGTYGAPVPYNPPPSAPPPPAAAPMPPAEAPVPPEESTQLLPPQPAGAPDAGRQPLPESAGGPESDAEATQLIPPFQDEAARQPGPLPGEWPDAARSDSEATQYIAPINDGPGYGEQYGGPPPESDSEATQMIPPQTAGAPEAATTLRSPLPPESGGTGGTGGGQARSAAAQAGPPPASAPYGARPGAPGAPGEQRKRSERQPPAGFENLFRADPTDDPANDPGSTQSLPLFDHVADQQSQAAAGPQGRAARRTAGHGAGAHGSHAGHGSHGGHGGHGGRGAGHGGSGRGGGSRMSPAVLIGVGIGAVAVVGLVAGAVISGGGDEDEGAAGRPAKAPAAEKSSAAPDPAEGQAKQLDKLLQDSNNSRSTVIRSVENIKSCQKLGKSADDLRSAAEQRNSLVTRLNELTIDEVPDNADLKTSLTQAWKSSASADSHYAAWADQVAKKGKKACPKGKARTTGHTAAGNTESGKATTAKKKAAGLWNPTAKKYGLHERQFGQL